MDSLVPQIDLSNAKPAPQRQAANVIELEAVFKKYGKLSVLKGLTLSVRQGEVYGFLGRNGAGKSTAIRILMGVSNSDRGRVSLFGSHKKSQIVKHRQRIGFVAQEQNFYSWMNAKALGKFVGGFYPRWDKSLYSHLLQSFELPNDRRIAGFSGGMKAKLALSLALSSKPELLLLDEPTAGMDPVARREFLDIVHSQAQQEGTTIFFSTHLMGDIEAVANRIGILDKGRLIYEGPLSALSDRIAAYSRPSSSADASALPGELAPGSYAIIRQTDVAGTLTQVIQFADFPLKEFELNPGWQRLPMSLEDIFVAIVSGT
ncbi:MAG: ABC transporter ATP-binding protein [Gammaproteobacteria bacterium]|nr:ABC transporter ATP-binding protein [Gammaproteobacteria bacterium]